MVEEQERFIAMRDFFLGFAETVITHRQAEAIAKHYIRYKPDPLLAEHEQAIAFGRQEFAAQQRVIQKKNTDVSSLTRALKDEMQKVANLRAQLARKS